jgi:hypothetical protein
VAQGAKTGADPAFLGVGLTPAFARESLGKHVKSFQVTNPPLS